MIYLIILGIIIVIVLVRLFTRKIPDNFIHEYAEETRKVTKEADEQIIFTYKKLLN